MAGDVIRLLISPTSSAESREIQDQALRALHRLLDCSCSQKTRRWLDFCLRKMSKLDECMLLIAQHVRDICCLCQERRDASEAEHSSQHGSHRQNAIKYIIQDCSVTGVVAECIKSTRDKLQNEISSSSGDTETHQQKIQSLLGFLNFLATDGALRVSDPALQRIWCCLTANGAPPTLRDHCFQWFTELLQGADQDQQSAAKFFESCVLKHDVTLLTEGGVRCFNAIFNSLIQATARSAKRQRTFQKESRPAIEYFWKVVTQAAEDLSLLTTELILASFNSAVLELPATLQRNCREDFIRGCVDRLHATHDAMPEEGGDSEHEERLAAADTLCRVMRVLQQYVLQCDQTHIEERVFLPLCRAYRGKHLSLVVRLSTPSRTHDLTMELHGRETLAAVRRLVLRRTQLTAPASELQLSVDGVLLPVTEDAKCLDEIGAIQDGTVLTVRHDSLSEFGVDKGGERDTSVSLDTRSDCGSDAWSDSCFDSSLSSYLPAAPPTRPGRNVQPEKLLPGFILSQRASDVEFLLQLADLGSRMGHDNLRDAARSVLQAIPADQWTVEQLWSACEEAEGCWSDVNTLEGIFDSSPSHTLYYLQVLHSLLMPADGPLSYKCAEFYHRFFKSGGAVTILSMLRDDFLCDADSTTRTLALLEVLRLTELVLNTVVLASSQSSCHQEVVLPRTERLLRFVAAKLADKMGDAIKSLTPEPSTVHHIMKLVWTYSGGQLPTETDSCQQIDRRLCHQAMQALPVALFLRPDVLEPLTGQEHIQRLIRVAFFSFNPRQERPQSSSEEERPPVQVLDSPVCGADGTPVLNDATPPTAPLAAGGCTPSPERLQIELEQLRQRLEWERKRAQEEVERERERAKEEVERAREETEREREEAERAREEVKRERKRAREEVERERERAKEDRDRLHAELVNVKTELAVLRPQLRDSGVDEE